MDSFELTKGENKSNNRTSKGLNNNHKHKESLKVGLILRDIIEVAVFILVLIAIPVMVSRSNSNTEKVSVNGGTKEMIKSSGTMDPKAIEVKPTTSTEVKQVPSTEMKDNKAEEKDNKIAVVETKTETKLETKQNLAELKLSPEATTSYLKGNNYEIFSNSTAGAIIILPDSFSAEKGGIKTGEMLKDRNEKSKREVNLDFAPYMGKTVYLFTSRVRKDDSQEKNIVTLACGEKVIGFWTDLRMEDYNFLNNNLGEKAISPGSTNNPAKAK